MSKKNKTFLVSAIIGVVLGCIISAPIGSIIWVNSNPSIFEARNAITENLTLTEQELKQVNQMVIVGAVIDFTLHLMLYVIPAICVGGFLGIFGGFLWIRRKQKSAKTEVGSP